ncbi:unnamed protein product [Schistosoma margrebowiei]|uniref:Uncharacterized protein n=1 Tax=Schistosoma margrebowiei TaxID=48269 RepID=A0A183N468_9TREM|nr:unnamed protein product [Schistosoma margrebowiei]
MFIDLPLFSFPSGFQVSWRMVCSLPEKAVADGIGSADTVLRRQLFMNTCTFLMVVVVVLQVSVPCSRTALTFVLKILSMILVDSCFEFYMFFTCRNATLALPILAFTTASDPPCSSTMLPRYLKDSTSSIVSPSSVAGLVFSVL